MNQIKREEKNFDKKITFLCEDIIKACYSFSGKEKINVNVKVFLSSFAFYALHDASLLEYLDECRKEIDNMPMELIRQIYLLRKGEPFRYFQPEIVLLFQDCSNEPRPDEVSDNYGPIFAKVFLRKDKFINMFRINSKNEKFYVNKAFEFEDEYYALLGNNKVRDNTSRYYKYVYVPSNPFKEEFKPVEDKLLLKAFELLD